MVSQAKFGFCRHGHHHKCPVVIDIQRKDNQGTYRKQFECVCECHDREEDA